MRFIEILSLGYSKSNHFNIRNTWKLTSKFKGISELVSFQFLTTCPELLSLPKIVFFTPCA